ncbi:predicted protein [Nematostella vectensis]|uniref:Cadherin domain-containing protein n=1 Tax=Nematostella vectensis TaxID=45351 RepID=A7SEI0_NEMVE|nr:uncharacterized protein LOC5509412 [Nematostella vectensis]EDO37882.1 predicted protein [Nematostella vectensis]|eukprot:XP_001629945.1 predicted protein [Nematostella vectensis]
MEFRAPFSVGIVLVLCLVPLGAVRSRPVAGDGECVISEQYKCGEKECNCKPISVWPGFQEIFRRLLAFQSPLIPSAEELDCGKCDVTCERQVVVKCENGVCQDDHCACLPCWRGKSCDQPDLTGPPEFEQKEYEAEIREDAAVGDDILTVTALDRCSKHPDKIRYSIAEESDDELLTIDENNGRIKVAKSLESSAGKSLELTVQANKGADQSVAKAHVRVTVRETGRQRRSTHHVMRRAVSSSPGSLILRVLVPDDIAGNNVTFLNTGGKITYQMELSHNTSGVTIQPQSGITVECWGSHLTPSALSSHVLASETSRAGNNITFSVPMLTSSDVAKANFEATVNAGIFPLANLYFSCSASASGFGVGPVFSLVKYAVFPKATIERTSHSGVTLLVTGTEVNYKMTIDMPELNFPLLVEISSAINDFSFMEVKEVTVNTGSKITGGSSTPTPTYHKSNLELLFNDRSVLDFKDLTVGASATNSDKQITVDFTAVINDHPDLFNGSKHWIGAGLRSGYQMLWVGQEAIYVEKVQPTVGVFFKTLNDSLFTRYYYQDRLSFDFTVKHTNTSTADARNVNVTCYFPDSLTFISGTYSVKGGSSQALAKHNATTLTPIQEAALNQGDEITGTMEVEVSSSVTPLVKLDPVCRVEYSNLASEPKLATKHTPDPSCIAGVPVFVLNQTTSGPYRIGSKACFRFSAMVRRMSLPMIVEILAPVNGSAVFSLTDLSSVTVGSNIDNYASLATKQFTMRSTTNDTAYFDRANLDLGNVQSTQGATPSALNEISFTFCVVLNDHPLITDGSKHWVGVGVKGGPSMMWIGEIGVTADVPVDRKPVLKVEVSCETESKAKCHETSLPKGSIVVYNVTIAHDPESQQHANEVNATFMMPPYVKFIDELSRSSQLTQKVMEAGPKFSLQSGEIFRFLDSLKMSFSAQLDPNGMMPVVPSPTLAVSVLDVTFTGSDSSAPFRAPLAQATAQFVSAAAKKPPAESATGYWEKGIYVDSPSGTLYVCQHNADSAKPNCYYSPDCMTGTWIPMDPFVGCIIGQSGSTVYAIAKNKLAYIKQNARDQHWEALTKQAYDAVKSSTNPDKVIKFDSSGGLSQLISDAGKEFKADSNGVHCRATSSDVWTMKAQWKCCGN